MADRICIFAGTTEGRKLAALLGSAAEVTVCVATEYGEVVLNGIPHADKLQRTTDESPAYVPARVSRA